MSGTSLLNLGELSRPATLLVQKIGQAIGGLFRPFQIVRIAKAEAEAERIRAESQIEITDLHRRALHRFLEEEAMKQSNIERITQQAIPLLDEQSSPDMVQDDWITNFFDKCRIISDDEMQKLWARVLAGEANSPGAFSRRTVNLVADLDKSDAQLFTALCGFGWMIGDVVPLVFDVQSDIYNRNGIHFGSISHLDSLGLLQFSSLTGFTRVQLPKNSRVHYYGRPLDLTMPNDVDNELELGHVLLTRAGQELSRVCKSRPIEGFWEYVYDRWAAASLVPKRTNEPEGK